MSTVPASKRTASQVSDHLRLLVTKGLSRLATLWHLTSLDAPTVAVCWASAFAWAAGIRLQAWVLITLALAAWTVYIGDRLLDAYRARSPLRARHYFHWRYRQIFVPIALASFAVGMMFVVRFMPIAARGRNSMLVGAALAYFTGVHSGRRSHSGIARRLPAASALGRFPLKEMLVGIIFTLACAAPTWTRAASSREEMIGPILCLAALAWLNCRAIEIWESSRETQTHSLDTVFRIALMLALLIATLAGIECLLGVPRFGALMMMASASAALLAVLDRGRHRMDATLLRACADLVLLAPLALLALA